MFFLDKGKITKSTKDSKVDYILPSSSDLFSPASNIINGISGISGNRVLLGDKSSLQAVSLVHREEPLVHPSESHKGDTFIQEFGKKFAGIESQAGGVVESVDDNKITVKNNSGKKVDYFLYSNMPTGKKNFLDQTSIVHVGQKIKKGDSLAKSNYTDDKGNLALGVNLNTAIMPFRGKNFEDGYVVSQSGAKKLAATHIVPFRIETKFGVETGKSRYISLFANKYNNTQIASIDSDGVIMKGRKVKQGDPLILAFQPKTLKSTDMQLGKLSKVLKQAFTDASVVWDYEADGEVVDVSKSGSLITVNVKTEKSLGFGDKISMFSGSKGVVTVVDDALVPTTKDGKPVDVIFNSMSITSRVNPSLLSSLALGKVAKKLGHKLRMTPFTTKSSIEEVEKLLKKHNIEDQEDLYDPVTGRNIRATVGPLYFNRLGIHGEDKETSMGVEGSFDWQNQPSKSSHATSSKRIGNLATMALLSHGARHVLEDTGLRSTRNDDFWRRYKLGQPLPPVDEPFAFNKFLSYLQGSGVAVNEHKGNYTLLPQTDKDIDKLSFGKIDNANTFKLKKGNLIPEKGGLFDPIKVGVYGTNYNHVDLNMKVPNPVVEDNIRKLLDVTTNELNHLITSNQLEGKLKSIDLDRKIDEYKTYIKSGRKSKRDAATKGLLLLTTMKKNGIQPIDLLLSKVSVIPAQYRPSQQAGDLVLSADVNSLYKDLILTNDSLKDVDVLPDEETKHKTKMDTYNAVKAVYGLGHPVSEKNKQKQLRGLLSSGLGIKGGSGKYSMYQSKVVNKPVDRVARGVLVPEADLGIDEVSFSQDAVWKVFKSDIMRALVQRGIGAIKAQEMIEDRNPMAAQILQTVMKNSPVMVSRDPQLHKYSFQGFFPKMNVDPTDHSLKLNPLVFKQYNADIDGDAMNIHAPVTAQAKQEILDKMLPSRNPILPKNMQAAYFPTNEAALGLGLLSQEDKKNKPIRFKSNHDIVNAFNNGDIDISDRVDIG